MLYRYFSFIIKIDIVKKHCIVVSFYRSINVITGGIYYLKKSSINCLRDNTITDHLFFRGIMMKQLLITGASGSIENVLREGLKNNNFILRLCDIADLGEAS